jgi:GT2 family glycosyltransferase
VRVRAVVVTFNNATFVADTLDALVDSGPDEIVVVDNSSTDGTADLVARRFPEVRLIRSASNIGFGGGVNLALDDLGAAPIDAIALVNSDMVVSRDWLGPLAAALEGGHDVAAACPKILLAPRFCRVRVDSPTFVPGGGDARVLGLRCVDISVGDGSCERDAFGRTVFASGWSIDEGHARWTTGSAVAYVPVEPGDTVVRLRFDGPGEQPDRLTELGETFDVINNVGNELDARWYGRDRGYLEVDRGQYDRPEDVWGWCGGAVLLRADALRQCGLFDERFFLYYEDVDLAMRQRAAGWRFRYVPTSVTRHGHAQSLGTGSALFDHLNQRNRLLVAWRHLPKSTAALVTARYVGEITRSAWGEVVHPLAHRRRPHPHVTRRRARALAAAVLTCASSAATTPRG